MDEKLKVSIIVPVHDAANTIENCVLSIVEQSYSNIECILVENGSSDNSLEKCRYLADTYDCVKVLKSEQVGVSSARNLGLSAVTGEIIGFCDADDFLEQDSISIVVAAFLNNPDIIGVMSAFYIGSEGLTGLIKKYKGIRKNILSAEEAIILSIGNDNVMGSVWNRFYRTEVAKRILFHTDLSYCEDTYYNVKLLSGNISKKLLYAQQALYCYMMNESSATNNRNRIFDENGELKYIIALKRILSDCHLNRKCSSIVKMQIVVLAIEHLWFGVNSQIQAVQLKKEIKENVIYFIKNIWRFNFIKNIKRLIKIIVIRFR